MSLEFLKAWEHEHGTIPDGAWVLYRTDWSKKNPKRLTSTRMRRAVITRSPFWLRRGNIIGVGVETVGTDGQDPMFPCHNLMHGANKCGWEFVGSRRQRRQSFSWLSAERSLKR